MSINEITPIYQGFSTTNLKPMRQFHKVYSANQIGETVFTQFDKYKIYHLELGEQLPDENGGEDDETKI